MHSPKQQNSNKNKANHHKRAIKEMNPTQR